MPKIAYSLNVHKNPDQVARLFDKIYAEEDFFHFQIFRTNQTPKINVWKDKLSAENKKNIFIFSNYKGSHSLFNFVEATLEAMKFFQKFSYDYFINLSGQCYPLRTVDYIKKELQNRDDAYLHFFPLPSKNLRKGGLDRIHNHWFRIYKLWVRIPKIQKSIPYDLKPYAGSNWFCLPKKFVDYTLLYIKDHPDIIPYFLHSRCGDEIFFQTIFLNSPLKSKVINNNKRYIDWKKKGVPLPAVLATEDYPKLMNSGMWFARKFDIKIDRNILDLIDRNIMRM